MVILSVALSKEISITKVPFSKKLKTTKDIEKRWEYVGHNLYRLKVPGGWIVTTHTDNAEGGVHSMYIKDSEHTWRVW